MTFAEYRAIKAANWSALKHLWAGSPLLYRHRLGVAQEETAAMLRGRAVHLAVFEPDRLPLACAVWTEGDRRGNAWKEFKAANDGRTILKANEYAECLAIRDAVRGNPIAAPFLARGQAEQTIRWTDRETGVACKGRVDWLDTTPGHVTIVDLKTTRSVETRAFCGQHARLGTHLQMAHYRNGVKALTGAAYVRVVILAVEATAPYDVCVYEYADGDLAAAADELASLLVRLKYHRDTDTWPGRYPEAQVLPIPPWVYGEDEIRITPDPEE